MTINFTDAGAVMDGQHSRMTSGARMLLSADRESVDPRHHRRGLLPEAIKRMIALDVLRD